MWWMIFPTLLVIFIAVILIRALAFVPRKEEAARVENVFVNGDKAVRDLAEMVRCRTVSDRDPANEDESQFERFESLLPRLFPEVYKKCELEKVSDRSLLFRWKGKREDSPSVFMAHYDVVSVAEEDWKRPAFDGVIENGVLWGRGTLDTKCTVNAILQSVEALIGEGFIPERDVYLAFGGDEEIGGHGASDIVALFRDRGITPGLVLDEGGAVCYNVFPGVRKPLALIGIAEKGMVNIEYSVKGGGGHSSTPKAGGPVARLSSACLKVEKRPFKYTVSAPTAQFFDVSGRHSTFLYRIIFANLWCFGPVLSLYSALCGGEINAVLRTTTAFTQMEGSKGANVIPPVAKMTSNHRIIPGETVDSVVKRVTETVNDSKVSVRVINGNDPSVVSDTCCEAYERVRSTIAETWRDAAISPYLMIACSDSRHWGVISDKVYRFSPMVLTDEERATIHGNDERISLSTISKTVEFFTRIMKKC